MQREHTKATRRGAPPRRGRRGPGRAPGARAERSASRREAILAAALDEFSAQGFAATRLDDVARRAGVAKGTIYLYFADKETLFQELIRSALSPFVATLEAAPDLPLRTVVEMLVTSFVREVLGTRRKDIVRLVLAEGRRFPKVSEFYYREVVGRAMAAMRALMLRAVERGEIGTDALARFPQLVVAPALVAIIWEGLFDRFERLDVDDLMRTHFELLFRGLERRPE